MRPISVLLTNNALAQRGGSETYVLDVARALLRLGHRPAVFSLVHGDTAAALRQATIPVVDDITRLGEAPDVIHGHHHLETLIAALAFPGVPIVNFCHGWLPWEERPLVHPSVRRYVAVDEVCVDRLVREEGIPPARVDLLLNFVDLDRFPPRPPLPPRPARALVLSNAAEPGGYVRAIGAACREAGIALDVAGAAAGNPTDAPETLLPAYDLVFAKARTALEAMAVGCATVLSDRVGAGPLVTPETFDVLRVRNFGVRTLTASHDPAWYARQIAAYDPVAARAVTGRVRAEAGLGAAMTRLLDIYQAAMAEPAGEGEPSRAAAAHLSRIAQPLKQAHGLTVRIAALEADLAAARASSTDDQRRAADDAHRAAVALAAVDALRARLADAEREIAAYRALPTLRLRNAVLATPVAGHLLQRLARRLAGSRRIDAPGVRPGGTVAGASNGGVRRS